MTTPNPTWRGNAATSPGSPASGLAHGLAPAGQDEQSSARSRTGTSDSLDQPTHAAPLHSSPDSTQPAGSPLVPGQRAAAGVLVGSRYTLRTAIGHGGMGTVWRASDSLLRRDVAVKEVLLPQGMAPADRDGMYQRTMREARAAAALSHPAVVQVYDVVTDGGRPWIVMELLQARSLSEIIVEDGPLAPRAVAKIGIALLGALEVAHAAGVLHRDVKPANVLICSDGRCVLTDFGVARMPTDAELTTPGMVLGSPHFISPERAIGAHFGPPSDLFSLGVTLYTAVEGKPPFDKGDPFETMRAVVEEQPVSPTRAGALAELLYGLLEKDPSRRWDVPTARTVLRDLMAGPLASSAPAHVTDPYAVVRPAPWTPPPGSPEGVTGPAVIPRPTEKIGGRAMLAPGESLTDRLRRLRRDATAGKAAAGAGAEAGASAAKTSGSIETPTGAMPVTELHDENATPVLPFNAPRFGNSDDPTLSNPAARQSPGQHTGGSYQSAQGGFASGFPTQAGSQQQSGYQQQGGHQAQSGQHGQSSQHGQGGYQLQGGYPEQGGYQPGGYQAGGYQPGSQQQGTQAFGFPTAGGQAGGFGPAGYQPGGQHQPGGQQQPGGYPQPGGATVYGGGAGAGSGSGGSVLDKLRALPRPVQLAALGGLALILVIVLVGTFAGWFSGDGGGPTAKPGPVKTSEQPLIPTQQFKAENGITVNVPEGWIRSDVSTYTDFTEPGSTGRRVRINVDKAGGTARAFIGVAERGLATTTKVCATPYHQIAVRDTTLEGRPAAELEYTCGQGDQMRHGIWRATTVNGKAYHFYLTAPATQFDDSKVIFDEMVRTFQLDPAVVGN